MRMARFYTRRRDDALRRPLPLPGPVPEPVPARVAREVQGLAARPRLDARQPDRPDGRLHAHFLNPAEGGLDPSLPALRDVGAPDLDLLPVDDPGRALDALGARRPRQAGALPSPAPPALARGDEPGHLLRDARGTAPGQPDPDPGDADDLLGC